jgi:hypothetical protein
MGDSGSNAGATIHASFRPLHRAAAGSLRTIYKNASLFVFSAEYAAFMDCTDRIHHFTHSTDQSRTEGARDSLARGRQGA